MTDPYLRRRDVERETKLGRTTIYRRMRDGTFPRPFRIGPNSVRWRASDIERWKASHPPNELPSGP